MSTQDESVINDRKRKSLAVDQATYDQLAEICFKERRTKIDQLKILIENEHARLLGGLS